METTYLDWSRGPVKKTTKCQSTRVAVTSQAGEDLELQYANSLIRVIRSRKDNGTGGQPSVRSAPAERSVPVADSVLLLSGCRTFNGERRAAERLAPLASSTHRSLPTEIHESSSWSHRSSMTTEQSKRAATLPQYLAPTALIFGHREQSQAKRKPEPSVLSKLWSPPGIHEQKGVVFGERSSASGLACKWSENGTGSRPEKHSATPTQEARASPQELETASGPGVATFKDSHVSSTVNLSMSWRIATNVLRS